MKVIWQILFFSYNIPYENIKYSKILHRTLVVNQKVYDKANSKIRSFFKNKLKTILTVLYQYTAEQRI